MKSGLLRFLCRTKDGIYLRTASNIMIRSRTSTTDFLGSIRCLFTITRAMRRNHWYARIRDGAEVRRRIEICSLRLIRSNACMLRTFTCFRTRYLFSARTRNVTILIYTRMIRAINRDRNLQVNRTFTRLLSAPISMTTINVGLISSFALR